MKILYKFLRNVWAILSCITIVTVYSLKIIFSANKNSQQRLIINRIIRKASVRLLRVVAANYTVFFSCPIFLDQGGPYIFMSNHQSLMDIPLIYATMPSTIRHVVKKELFYVPFFGVALKKCEAIFIDRKHPQNATNFPQIVKDSLAGGIALWFFPEGVRSKTGELLPFKMSGFRLAQEAHAKIIPVGIMNTRAILPAKSATFSVKQSVCIRVGKPISIPETHDIECLKSISTQVRAAILQLMDPNISMGSIQS